MRATLLIPVFVWLVITSTLASAQTLSLAVDDQGVYTRSFDVVTSEQFDIVTRIDTAGNEISAAEWVQTELIVEFPGLIRTQHQIYNDWCRILLCLDCCGEYGEYIMDFGECVPPSEDLLVVRNTYVDFSGVIPDDVVLTIRGLQPGDSMGSTFGGSPGFVDCDGIGTPASMAGGDAWETGSGVVVPSGALVLNPTPPLVVGAEGQSMSAVKARHR